MSRRKNFRQPDWLIELSPRKNVEQQIVGIRSTFSGSTFFPLVEIRLKNLKLFHIELSHSNNYAVQYRNQRDTTQPWRSATNNKQRHHAINDLRF